MPVIDLNLDGDDAWTDIGQEGPLVMFDGTWQLAALEAGMSSGAPSLALRLDVELIGFDRPVPVIAQTSLAAWISATCALRGRFPDAFAGTPLEARD
jgi:hypothetical protein